MLEQEGQPRPEFCRVLHLQKLARHDHRQAPSVLQHFRSEFDEGHPRIGEAARPVAEPAQQAERSIALRLLEILETNERRIANRRVESLAFEQWQRQIEKAAAVPMHCLAGIV